MTGQHPMCPNASSVVTGNLADWSCDTIRPNGPNPEKPPWRINPRPAGDGRSAVGQPCHAARPGCEDSSLSMAYCCTGCAASGSSWLGCFGLGIGLLLTYRDGR